MATDTSSRLIEATRECLLESGYGSLSTRMVAERAGVPLSQIHYHFGGRAGLVLALLDNENERLLARQQGMYAADEPLSRRYDQACDFLDEDLASGYVRILQEMIAAGWSDPAIAARATQIVSRWTDLLRQVVRDAEQELGPFGPLSADDVAHLIGMAFLGGESLLLLSEERWSGTVKRALRQVGELIRTAERAEQTTVTAARSPHRASAR